MRKLKPVTPGELLLEEFLKPMGISRYRLAKEIAVPAQRIGDIVAGRRTITADTDLRLCRFFGIPTATGYALRQPTTPKLLNALQDQRWQKSNRGQLATLVDLKPKIMASIVKWAVSR